MFPAAALLCLGIGAFLLWVTATADPALRVPRPIAYLAASLFLVAAFRLLQLHFRPRSQGNGFAALIATGFAVIGGWIAVGSGTRVCGVGSGVAVPGTAEGLACRAPFGIGALLAAGIAFYAALRWVRASRRSGRQSRIP